MKYLGVIIPKNLTKIYATNYGSITKELKADLDRWRPLTFSLYDRIEIIKMNVLPRLLFLFQSLPVEIPKKKNNLMTGIKWSQDLYKKSET